MSQPDVTREQIATQADAAAQQMARTGLPAVCPYEQGSEAARIWKCDLQRFLLLHSAPANASDIEGGA